MFVRTQDNKLINLNKVSMIFQQGNRIKAILSGHEIILSEFDTLSESVRCYDKIGEEIETNKSLIDLYNDISFNRLFWLP